MMASAYLRRQLAGAIAYVVSRAREHLCVA